MSFMAGVNLAGQIGIIIGPDGVSHNPLIQKEWATNPIPYSIRSFDGASNKFGLIVDIKVRGISLCMFDCER
jgi:hypothetical protein